MGGAIAIFAENAVANEPGRIAGPHGDFAQNFGQCKACGHHIVSRVLWHNNFEQFHDICRAEKMQTQHVFAAIGGAGNFIYVDIARIGGQYRIEF